MGKKEYLELGSTHYTALNVIGLNSFTGVHFFFFASNTGVHLYLMNMFKTNN